MKNIRRGLGRGKGSGYKNIIRSDPVVHQRAGKHQKTYSTPTEKRMQVIVDWNKVKSIKEAERKKSMLENQGFDLIKTEKVGLDKFKLSYELTDSDGDGVPDKFDCKPYDPKRQDKDESYQGWTNWDTWNTMLILDNDERTSNWLNEWAKNFKKKKEKGKFDYEKAEKVVKKYLVPVARGNKSWVTSRQLYAGQRTFVGDKSIDPKKVNAREVVDAILEREV